METLFHGCQIYSYTYNQLYVKGNIRKAPPPPKKITHIFYYFSPYFIQFKFLHFCLNPLRNESLRVFFPFSRGKCEKCCPVSFSIQVPSSADTSQFPVVSIIFFFCINTILFGLGLFPVCLFFILSLFYCIVKIEICEKCLLGQCQISTGILQLMRFSKNKRCVTHSREHVIWIYSAEKLRSRGLMWCFLYIVLFDVFYKSFWQIFGIHDIPPKLFF